MAEVIPFRGERYNLDKIPSPEQVIAPPFDVISDPQLQELRQRSAHNIVHLLLAPQLATDTETDNRYTRTGELLRHWRWTEVLTRDTEPSFYLYEQHFVVHELEDVSHHVRRALFVRVRLEPFSARVIFPHEKTLAAPKEDRLNLLRQCHTNLSPVFGLYSDPDSAAETLYGSQRRQPPTMELRWSDERTGRFWRVTDTNTIAQIQGFFAPRQLVIADGHHRYETALFYRDEYLQRHPDHEGCRYVMMALVQMESPGLVVLPIHRLLHYIPEATLESGWQQLDQFVERKFCASPAELIHALHHTTGTAFGVHTRAHGCALLKLRQDIDITPYLEATHSDVYNALDVTRLHAVILKQCFGIDTSIVSQQRQVSYTEDVQEAVEEVEKGRAQLAFLLNPTRVDQVRDVALAGETMPQKSTFFHPKLMTGFVLNPLD